MLWRLVMRQIATYEEIRRYWSIDDVLTANEHLDLQEDAEWLSHEASKSKSRRGRRK